MNIYDHILKKISKAHNEWVNAHTELRPDLITARKKHHTGASLRRKTYLLHLMFFILNFFPKKKPRQYIFEGLRHAALMETLPANEVTVLGGRNEWLYCFRKGYRFHWVGYITHAFQLYIFGGRKKLLEKAIHRIYTNCINNVFDGYLFLWEDSLPVGMTLSAVFSLSSMRKVVCIAHGIEMVRSSSLPPEGLSCKFILIWDKAEKKIPFFAEFPAIFVLGLPYDVKPSRTISREIVLIGHCGVCSDRMGYLLTLYRYIRIYEILHDAGWKVVFRPHPEDDIEFVKKIFPIVCTDPKQKLFLEKKVFIGHISSLMFEAIQFGNIVFGLETKDSFGYERIFDVDRCIAENEYSKLPFYLEKAFNELESRRQLDIVGESLSVRFDKCLKQIDEFVDQNTEVESSLEVC